MIKSILRAKKEGETEDEELFEVRNEPRDIMLSQREDYLLVNYPFKSGADVYKFYDRTKEKVD